MELLLATLLMLLMMPISYAMLDVTVRKIKGKIGQTQKSQDKPISDE
jgi:hypothetical protein